MEFVKMHGAGNDFILVEDFDNKYVNDESEIAVDICHRRFGIGADGLVLIRKSLIGDIKMDIINSDGSKANMCGNAIRCFSKYVFENKIVNSSIIKVETGDGIKEVEVAVDKSGFVNEVKVSMGNAFFEGNKVNTKNGEKVINKQIVADDKEYTVTSLLVGVPHTIVLEKDENYDILEGRFIEKHELYNEGTNVNFIKIIDKDNISVRTWERGAGATYCCGTGCSAAVAVTSMFNLTGKEVKVKAPGGELKIEIVEENIYMTGKAELICKGVVFLNLERK